MLYNTLGKKTVLLEHNSKLFGYTKSTISRECARKTTCCPTENWEAAKGSARPWKESQPSTIYKGSKERKGQVGGEESGLLSLRQVAEKGGSG